MTTERDWITGHDLAAVLGHPARLEILLRDYLRVGMVTAQAKAATLTGSEGRAAFVRPRTVRRDWQVPSSVWEANSNESSFNLLQGKYATARTGISGVARVELIGLSFDKVEALDALELEGTLAKSVDRVKASNAGAKTDKARWAAFAGALAAAEHRGDIDPSSSIQSIYETVAAAMTECGDDNPLSVDSVRAAIATYKRLACAD